MPIFLVDAEGTLVFYNEPAEHVLGVRFEETGEMPASQWATAWSPTGCDGAALAPDQIPLVTAVVEQRPAHRGFYIRALDGHRRYIEVTAIPLIRAGGEVVGAAAFFWESRE
jgi:PAS domain-containing protein